jgi:hypothetical protein
MKLNNFPLTQTYVGSSLELAYYIERVLYKYLKLETHHNHDAKERHPVIGIAIVTAYVQNLVDEFCSQQTREVPISFEEIVMPYILDEWQFVYDEERKENVLNHDLFSQLRNNLLDLRTDVKIFLGTDRWVMHQFKAYGADFFIYKGVDFRIADWTRRMEEGEWESAFIPAQSSLTANEQALIDEKNHRQREAKEKAEHLAQFGKI